MFHTLPLDRKVRFKYGLQESMLNLLCLIRINLGILQQFFKLVIKYVFDIYLHSFNQNQNKLGSMCFCRANGVCNIAILHLDISLFLQSFFIFE